jgi:hypothetical protein
MEDQDIPWLRRDSEPHRGPLLMLLATAALLLSLGSCLAVPGLVAVALGLAVREMALRDLKRIDAGLMDPQGEDEVGRAHERGMFALGFGLFGLLVVLGLMAHILWTWFS